MIPAIVTSDPGADELPTMTMPRRVRRGAGLWRLFALVATVAGPLAGGLYASSAAAADGPYFETYLGRNTLAPTTCNVPRSIIYYTPSTGTGPFPLLVWTPGTAQFYGDSETIEYLRYMADAGFVAASIEYDNDALLTGPEVTQKAKCVFDQANASSAMGKLDALGAVDVSKGIFTSGLSQGSFMAHLARNHHAQVRGAWLVGTMDSILGGPHIDEVHYTSTALENVRATNGQSDSAAGPGYCLTWAAGNAQQLKHVTGVGYGSACSLATSSPDNTTNKSWYVVPGWTHTSYLGFWNKLYPCSDPWSRCAIKNWALTLVTP
jgi:hypothetical protein